ncbi:DNA-3-methyladenine glycosylase family protein [Cohnella hashimotonis]|uniref:DNA-3-methyladenine glycosylase II n=1 Tax=Cohnella hashimotonis TaxID=2826895 RepID=A0ABT6TKC9_9BACL|nr:DNA-3-methyladenine glycosylase [Cohnella hashimotonis]MDI4647293.1 DNA-3-methyladenine glycosylase [Cohnella hashimotonis]
MPYEPTLTLATPEDYRFSANLGYLMRSPKECLHLIRDGRLYKALPLDGTPVLEIGADDDNRLLVAFADDRGVPSEDVRAASLAYIREWLDLDTDLEPFYRLAADDPILAAAASMHKGLRLIGIPDLFEAMAWGILGQQINLAFAYTLKARLVEAYGTPVSCAGDTCWTFPQPEVIAGLEVKDLLPLKLTVKKCEYLIHAAELIAGGALSKGRLQELGYREAEKALVRIRGIGPWTANYVLMRCLRMKDAFPIDDVGLHHALRHVTGSDAKPSREEILRLSAGWRGWESYATFYLWRLLY